MGVVNYAEQRPAKKVRQVVWNGVKAGDTCQVYDRGQGRFRDIDLSISGVLAGASVQPYGRLQAGDDWAQLHDSQGNLISLAAGNEIVKIRENPVELQWVLSGGDGTTLLNVALNLIGV